MAKKGPEYHVDQLPQVLTQIQRLAAKAKTLGIRAKLIDALEAIVRHLKTDPLRWGDPEYRTRKSGGWVCHGIYDPLIVHFAVYEADRAVLVLEIRALPGSRLE